MAYLKIYGKQLGPTIAATLLFVTVSAHEHVQAVVSAATAPAVLLHSILRTLQVSSTLDISDFAYQAYI